MKRYRESGEIEGGYWLLVIFGHCSKKRHDSVLGITTQAQSVSTCCRAIHNYKLKLCHARKKPYVNVIQKRQKRPLSCLGQSSFKIDWGKMEKFCGQMNQNLKFFLETTDAVSCRLQRRGGEIRLHTSKACGSDGTGMHQGVWRGQQTHLERFYQC